jgi:hypothetical protein
MSELKVGRIQQLTHTPGPWKADITPRTGNYAGSFSVEADGLVVCGRAGVPNRASESAANARLIAAAPDLLAALKLILPIAESYLKKAPGHPDNGKLADARDAIAKAEGR